MTDLAPHKSRGARNGDVVAQLDKGRVPTAMRPRGIELAVGFLLWPRFPLLSLAGFCDALRHAADLGDQSRQLRCTWAIVGNRSESVSASCGITVQVTEELGDPTRFDYLVVIGGLLSALDNAPKSYWTYLRNAAERNIPLVGMCTGSFVLARAGLMRNRTACIHAFHVNDYQRMFPDHMLMSHTDYYIDNDRITCAGGVSVLELAVRLINRHCGADRASKVVHQMTVSRRGGASMVEQRRALGYVTTDNALARRAVMLMEENLSSPLDIADVAEQVGTSTRHLERIFISELGVAPSDFYRTARLQYGRWLLLSSDKPITEIAYDCGFADAAHFIRHFKRTFGSTPGQLRTAANK